MIHQDLKLPPGLTVAENLYLRREPLATISSNPER
jgi:ABC-type sugar transport system ATPase subunit